MDWIIIYTIILCFFQIVMLGVEIERHNTPRDGKYNFWATIIAMILMLPIFGRIFGWW